MLVFRGLEAISGNGSEIEITTIAEAMFVRKNDHRQALERAIDEEARGESRTHFPQPSGGNGPSGNRPRREPSKQQCFGGTRIGDPAKSHDFDGELVREPGASERSRTEPEEPTGAERLRPEPSRESEASGPSGTRKRRGWWRHRPLFLCQASTGLREPAAGEPKSRGPVHWRQIPRMLPSRLPEQE